MFATDNPDSVRLGLGLIAHVAHETIPREERRNWHRVCEQAIETAHTYLPQQELVENVRALVRK